MGVTGLWTVLQPCARPIKLETLNKKRLAVDASIWIYQFLKAVRDKEGNALRNSHIVGFFRRICKLLFFGIKPVFVFDGGAPALKRQTIAARKRRREGRREDAVRTAGKLLALQVQRRAEEEQERRRREHMDRTQDEEETIPEDVVYVEELQMTPQERRQNRQFKKKDQYHLPDLEVSLEHMGAPDDLRIMSHEELEIYARQFHSGEDINLYDFSKIDFTSPFFLSLPTSDQYNILNAARLRSRLRMGYSKDQLDSMFPDRMAFSRFQIDRVRERNELTQRLMNLNSSNGGDGAVSNNGGARVAGEKGREYVLVKNDAVEGGWALGVVSGNSEGDRGRPIDVERLPPVSEAGNPVEESDDEDGGFEDVPIEGLNRLPKTIPGSRPRNSETERWAPIQIESSIGRTERKKNLDGVGDGNTESLFVDDNATGPSTGFDRQDRELLLDDPYALDEHEEQDLRRAIAMSMEDEQHNNIRLDQSEEGKRHSETLGAGHTGYGSDTSSPGRRLSAIDAASAGCESEDDMDLQAALAHSISAAPRFQDDRNSGLQTKQGEIFDGPLPFEKLNVNHLGAPSQGPTPQTEGGGFEIASGKPAEREPLPLPPWFAHDVLVDGTAQNNMNQRFVSNVDVTEGEQDYQLSLLRKQNSAEVIELDSSDEEGAANNVHMVGEGLNSTRLTSSTKSPISQSRRLFSTAMSKSDSGASHEMADESQTNSKVEERPTDTSTDTIITVTNTNEGAVVLNADGLGASKSPPPVFEDAMETIVFHGKQEERTGNQISRPGSSMSLKEVEMVAEIAEDDSNQYSDPEDDQLFQHLALEAEEHARFASSLNNRSKDQNQEDYERELRTLRSQQKKDRRDADEISNIMITECQQLLTLFGIPYITASMEAEAQCAELVRLGLVDGIVTDDSDCFLFGGTRVYKNMFSQAKYVECYLASDLEREFDLDRDKLIRFAHLLGSDYTEGIPGVGPVTALEILSEFNSGTGLEDFKQWWQGVQAGVQSPTDKTSPFRKKFRRNATRIFLPPAFPSVPVTQAYLHPEVDSSRDPFQWGVPDLDAIRAFLMSVIGWSKERTDEVLVPVIRDINRREHEGTQSNLTAFFSGATGAGAFAPRCRGVVAATSGAAGRPIPAASRRMEGALGKLKEGAKRKRGSVELDESVRDRDIDGGDLEEGGEERETATPNEAPSSRRGRRRTATTSSTLPKRRSRPGKKKAVA